MTKRQLAVLINRLAVQHPALVSKPPLLFCRPLGFCLRAILFERSSAPHQFYVNVFLQPLYIPTDHIVMNVGWRLGGGARTWSADNNNELLRLSELITSEALPFLNGIQKPNDVAAAVVELKKTGDPISRQAAAYSLAAGGESAAALRELDLLMQSLHPDTPWQRDMLERAARLQDLLMRNPSEASEQLSRWQRQTIQALDLPARLD